MSVSTHLKSYLDKNHVSYKILNHDEVYTAMESAEKQEVPGQEFAKTVVLSYGTEHAMAVLPSTYRVNLEKLSNETGAKDLKLTSESEFKQLFPDCDLGAMPPIGEFYHMPVWVDGSLTKDKEIVFNAGSHTETIRMSYEDFKKLVNPKVYHFGDRI